MSAALKNKIRDYINKHGLTASSFEKRAGLSHATVSQILNDRAKNPTAISLIRISKVLNCSIDELLADTPDTPIIEEESISLDWKSNIAIQAIREIQETCIKKKYNINADNAFFILRKVYDYTLKTERKEVDKSVDKSFVEWVIDETIS